jgi:hypothetical protein
MLTGCASSHMREGALMVAPFDGKGPAVEWFPRFMRPWVNNIWRRMGWPEPYDINLNKIPRAER